MKCYESRVEGVVVCGRKLFGKCEHTDMGRSNWEAPWEKKILVLLFGQSQKGTALSFAIAHRL